MLDPDELERYARHIVLREVGGAGQAQLRAAKVLVVGAGGLGSPVILYLAAAGVGTIGIVDFDTVSLSNLQRQVAHRTQDIGRLKTELLLQSGHLGVHFPLVVAASAVDRRAGEGRRTDRHPGPLQREETPLHVEPVDDDLVDGVAEQDLPAPSKARLEVPLVATQCVKPFAHPTTCPARE